MIIQGSLFGRLHDQTCHLHRSWNSWPCNPAGIDDYMWTKTGSSYQQQNGRRRAHSYFKLSPSLLVARALTWKPGPGWEKGFPGNTRPHSLGKLKNLSMPHPEYVWTWVFLTFQECTLATITQVSFYLGPSLVLLFKLPLGRYVQAGGSEQARRCVSQWGVWPDRKRSLKCIRALAPSEAETPP